MTMTLCQQLFKRRNVCVPSNDESMLECPIQDPDISSTVPVAGVSIGIVLCSVFKCICLLFIAESTVSLDHLFF